MKNALARSVQLSQAHKTPALSGRFAPERFSLSLLASCALATAALAAPLQLHPENPHYFLWQGKPEILITSGEHYGAVLNLDLDYRKYLATLAADKLNLTRL